MGDPGQWRLAELAKVSPEVAQDPLYQQVVMGLERIFRGEPVDDLSYEAESIILYISGRALKEFCAANAGEHDAWRMDESTWSRWIEAGSLLSEETERLLGPWIRDWIDGRT